MELEKDLEDNLIEKQLCSIENYLSSYEKKMGVKNLKVDLDNHFVKMEMKKESKT